MAPALNATLFGIIREAQRRKFRILGGMYGWASLGRNGRMVDLTKMNVASISQIGGTFLRSSRTNLVRQPDGVQIIKERMKQWKVDALVPVGGNDTLGAAKILSEHGVAIIGVPKTIDNDLEATYWTPGYPSAARYMADFVREIRDDAAYALSRIFIIESPGRDSGWLAAAGAMGGADVIVPPERKVSRKNFLAALRRRYEANGNFAVAVVAEHARFDDPTIQGKASDQVDEFGVKRVNFITVGLRDLIKNSLGIDSKALVPANFFETGRPFPEDRTVAEQLGRHAVELISRDISGRMVSVRRRGNRLDVTDVPLAAAVKRDRVLDDTYFDFKNFRPKTKFFNYLAPAFPSDYRRRDSAYLKLLRRLP